MAMVDRRAEMKDFKIRAKIDFAHGPFIRRMEVKGRAKILDEGHSHGD